MFILSAIQQFLPGSYQQNPYTLGIIRVSVQYGSHVWSELLIAANEAANCSLGPVELSAE
jgi:hypothetical protein